MNPAGLPLKNSYWFIYTAIHKASLLHATALAKSKNVAREQFLVKAGGGR